MREGRAEGVGLMVLTATPTHRMRRALMAVCVCVCVCVRARVCVSVYTPCSFVYVYLSESVMSPLYFLPSLASSSLPPFSSFFYSSFAFPYIVGAKLKTLQCSIFISVTVMWVNTAVILHNLQS